MESMFLKENLHVVPVYRITIYRNLIVSCLQVSNGINMERRAKGKGILQAT